MKFGIDVSSNNGIINWDNVNAQGVEFVIIRCGIGSNFQNQDDTQFERNYNECKRLGIPVGTYLYSYACNVEQAKSEASHVLRLIEGKTFELGIWFDMEDTDGYKAKRNVQYSTCVDICETFCNIIESKGLKVGIYASLDWLKNKINSSRLDKFDKWVAQWTKQCTYNKKYSIWQFGGETNVIRSNRLDGINGMVDMNYLIDDNTLQNPQQSETQEQPNYTGTITYQAYNGKWEKEVNKCDNTPEGYAGDSIHFISGVRAKPQYGEIIIEAHTLGGNWIGEISSKNYKTNDTMDGNSYAGIYSKPIDALRIKSTRGFVDYRVLIKNDAGVLVWLEWVRGFGDNPDEYAGILGKPIYGLQMK